jgi:D-alanyl-D-alanine carboxypeptidase/D-alanyl-D-alanine-endopeptidase (penicillin-binding protein 4)
MREFRGVMSSSRWTALAVLVCSAVLSAQSGVPAPPRSVDQLHHDIDAILGSPLLQHGLWGVVVKPVDRDETWYTKNGNTLMMPASSLKVVTLAIAAEKLGWDYRFETKVFAVGNVSGGTLNGDLVVVGSGDPSLDDWDGNATRVFSDWATQLKAAGITTISGRIVGDDNAFEDEMIGQGWAWDDLPAGFAAGVSALQFNEGNVQIRLGPGDAVGDRAIATISPDFSGLTLKNLIVTAPADSVGNVTRRRLPGSSRLELRGTLPLRGHPYAQTASVDNPTLYYANALRAALLADGISVGGPAVDIDDMPSPPSHERLQPLITYQSPPLSMLATTMMKLSQNQFAEAMFKTVGSGISELARTAERDTLQSWGIDPATVILADGSGLSRYNYITPETMVAVLTHVAHSDRLRTMYQSTLPIAGRDGTLELRMKGTIAEARAFVKTGSMNGVRTAAGYVQTADGQTLVFAIFANNFSNSSAVINAATDEIIVRLASYRSR